MSRTILRLGKIDEGQTPTNLSTFLEPYHRSMSPSLKQKLKFRDEANGVWRAFQEIQGNQIQNLQQFLKAAGFFADLILTYAEQGVTTLSYTLARDDTAFLSDKFTAEMIGDLVKRLKD